MKKPLLEITPAVWDLMAVNVNPTEVIVPVLMEVDETPDPKDYILNAPIMPAGWPEQMPQDAWTAAIVAQNLGLPIKDIGQPERPGGIVGDEIHFDHKQGWTGYFMIWRPNSGHTQHSLSLKVLSSTNHWIEVAYESGSLERLLRILKFAVQAIAPRVRLHPMKTGTVQAKQMMAKFMRNLREAQDPHDFIMQQDPAGVIGWVVRTTEKDQGPLLKGRYFPYSRALGVSFSRYIGDARIYRLKSTWMRGWPENFKRGYWELVPIFHDPRKYGERALNPQPDLDLPFGPLRESMSIEQQLIKIASTIRHCGDYGVLYYNPGTRAVHWMGADSDGPPKYTDPRDIKRMLSLPGITHVEIGDEWSPDEDEGWVELDVPRQDESLSESADLAYSLLCESPKFKTLKASKRSLSPEEKKQAGEAPVWKASVDGATWFVSNTHRCFQAHKSLSAAIKAYWDVVEPSG